MTSHLSPREFTDAVEGTLPLDRCDHLQSCAACRSEADALRLLLGETRQAGQDGEPSPLFWDHFSRRVQLATSAAAASERAAQGGGRMLGGWRLLFGVGSMAAAAIVTLTVMGRPVDRPMPSIPASQTIADSAVGAPAADAESWDFMLALAAGVPSEELGRMSASAPGAADAMADDLTPEQRLELVKILKSEIGAAE